MPDERRSLIGLFSDLWRETSRLIHAEVELASVEISEKVSDFGTGLVAMLIGGAVLFAGFLVPQLAAAARVYLLLQAQTEHAAAGPAYGNGLGRYRFSGNAPMLPGVAREARKRCHAKSKKRFHG